jgi:hypothetical protein
MGPNNMAPFSLARDLGVLYIVSLSTILWLGDASAKAPNILRDYAFVVCLSSAYEAGPADYHIASETLRNQSWWFVENSDAAPEIYERVFTYSRAFGKKVPADGAAIGCIMWRDSAEIEAIVEKK